MHQTVQVDLNSIQSADANPIFISCTKCDYKCKLRIQLRNHVKNKHEITEDRKFKCNACTFQTDVLLKIYEHKLGEHPETSIEFNPKTTTVKDMALNLISQQNLELMEEILDLKKGLKVAFEKLSDEIQIKYEVIENDNKQSDSNIKSVFDEFTKKLGNLVNVPTAAKKSAPRSSPLPVPTPGDKASHSTPPPPPPPPPTSNAGMAPPSKPAPSRKRKTAYLQKAKVLYVGDSLAHNVNLRLLEQDTKTIIKSIKAYSAVEDLKARWPHKNFTDVTPAALFNTAEDDKFTELILAAPTVDISNLNTVKLTKKCINRMFILPATTCILSQKMLSSRIQS
jgi:hypothetical protein